MSRKCFYSLLAIWMTGWLWAGELEDRFQSPPDEAKVRTWWHWVNNFISKEGITRDLEAMKKAGIGGATIFDVMCFHTWGEVKTLSPEWFAMVRHAVTEAKRLGLELSVQNCPGWNASGGPWIRPENAMKELRFSTTVVEGGRRIERILPAAESPVGFSRDVAVLAFPSLPGDDFDLKSCHPRLSTDIDISRSESDLPERLQRAPEFLWPGDSGRCLILNPARAKKPQSVIFEFERPFTAGCIVIESSGPPWGNRFSIEISASDDGVEFRNVFTADGVPMPKATVGFPVTTARFFRLSVPRTRGQLRLPLRKTVLMPNALIPELDGKALYSGWRAAAPPLKLPPEYIIAPDQIVNLSSRMDASGKLTWNAPAGKWTVMRFTMVARKSNNHPANPEGRGLECDKLSRPGVDAAWSGMMAKIVADAGPDAGKTLKCAVIDSYEAGAQNWTDDMPEEFRRRRGYDLLPYLPVFSGRSVRSPELSERFLQDLRLTVSDLFADYYGKYYSEVVHRSGLLFAVEPYGGPFDALRQGRHADIPMAEFWSGGSPDGVRLAASLARMNGRKFVEAESFTTMPRDVWSNTPAAGKVLGDRAFCRGLNRMAFHTFVHQPWAYGKPGLSMGHWGGNFNSRNTLWDFYPAWIAYLNRTQYLLQQGHEAVDVLYVTSEMPPVSPEFKPATPFGYAASACDARMLMEKAGVKDGRIVMGNGTSFSLLIVPDMRLASPEMLRKLKRLANDGATILLGNAPRYALGLSGFPDSDREVAALTKELWGDAKEQSADGLRLGRGRIFRRMNPGAVLKKLGAVPDFSADTGEVDYTHRVLPDADIYFIANVTTPPKELNFTARFRISGMAPQFWNPENGRITPAPVWSEENAETVIPITLKETGSVFVVFRRGQPDSGHFTRAEWRGPGDTRFAASALRVEDGNIHVVSDRPGTLELTGADGQSRIVPIDGQAETVDLNREWTVAFEPGKGAPESVTLAKLTPLNTTANPGVKYYSGTMTYRKSFEVAPSLAAEGDEVTLNLGAVYDIAKVFLNGQEVATLWHPPFSADVTGLLKPGKNILTIKVANRWINRLIGDQQLSEDAEWQGQSIQSIPQWFLKGGESPSGRIAFTTYRHFGKDSQPVSSGLVGPVSLTICRKTGIEENTAGK